MADGGGHRGTIAPPPPPKKKQNFQMSHPSVKQTQNFNMHFHCFLDNGGHTHVQSNNFTLTCTQDGWLVV